MNNTAEQIKHRKEFDKLNLSDWKGPIDVYINRGSNPQKIKDAIMFFTSTEATVLPSGNYWRVLADGYRAGPAN